MGNIKDEKNVVLNGTTLRVYRFLFRAGTSQGIHDIQRGLGLSSSSVADYHVKKLVAAGLVKQDDATSLYYVDRIVFENMIRIRKATIPLQVGYAVFFASALIIMITFLRPSTIVSDYLFAVIVMTIALFMFLYETTRTLRKSNL